jgi:cytochrome c-type biogenesis protein CcmH
MILFWLICAVFIVIAFAFVLPTALQRNDKSQRAVADERKLANIAVYRDQLSELEADLQNGIVSQEQYAQDREEIERRLLEDTSGAAQATTARKAAPVNRNTAYALAFGLPLVAVVFYWQIGNPKGITHPNGGLAPDTVTGERTQEPTQNQIEARVEALAKRLQTNPSDAQGWVMLARAYREMHRFGEAAGAYAKATELQPKDADLWAEYAYVSAMAGNQRFEGKPMELLNQALELDPENLKALSLSGTAAYQAKDYEKAIELWERVIKKAPPDAELREVMTQQINMAKAAAGK